MRPKPITPTRPSDSPQDGPHVYPPRASAALVLGAGRGLGLAFVEALLARGGAPETWRSGVSGPGAHDSEARGSEAHGSEIRGSEVRASRAWPRIWATSRAPERSALVPLRNREPNRLRLLAVDVNEEDSLVAAADAVRADGLALGCVIYCAGLLHNSVDVAPEKRLAQLHPPAVQQVFAVNAFGPMWAAKHLHPLMQRTGRSVWANISARVGSIGDNRLGGWYAYRASKAAQNMVTRCMAIELARRWPELICVALHPGTVDTELSKPFQRNVPKAQLQPPAVAAQKLLRVMEALRPDDHGGFLAYDHQTIPW